MAGDEKPTVHQTKAVQHRADNPQPSASQSNPLSISPAPSPAVGARLNLGSMGLTFSDLRGHTPSVTPQETVEDTAMGEHQSFTQDALELQWMMMCNRMPQEMTGLAARMKNMIPRITTLPHVEVVVDNDLILDEISKIKGKIRLTLVRNLHNDDIQLNIRLAEGGEVRKVLTKRELFEEMKQKNPSIEKLCELLSLELS